MLRLFSRIRRTWIGSSSGPYILYAIGEIVLVVIGILVALQVNNWNQIKNERITERQYLTDLVSDLDIQLKVNEDQLSAEERTNQLAEKILIIINSPDLFGQLDTLKSLLTELRPRKTFIIIHATYEDLKSTGNLKLLSNQNLRKGLISYYHEMETGSKVISLNNESLDDSYKIASVTNQFGFYYDSAGVLRNDKLLNPEHKQMLVELVEWKKLVSNRHILYVNNYMAQTIEIRKRIIALMNEMDK